MCASNKYPIQIPYISLIPNVHQLGRSMRIYTPHMNLLASTMWPGVLYYTDNDYANAYTDNNNTARICYLSWPFSKSPKNPFSKWPWSFEAGGIICFLWYKK